MKDNPAVTKKNILASAKKEFLEKGFTNASLRTIAANADVTTGALYRHFADKDALFCALVDDAAGVTRSILEKASVAEHLQLQDPFGKAHHQYEDELFVTFIDYLYSDFDAFVLLLEKSAGSTHEGFLQRMTDLYADKCLELVSWISAEQLVKTQLDPMTVHVIASNFITSIAELVFHRLPRADAGRFIMEIHRFYHSGWTHLFELDCSEQCDFPDSAR
ncbi:TetR/AcrR family transcriptional regulator [Treponema brennaborense]|uniref:Regulatory protein TetR n=1 Tax=Treponema brennaborense (strain DSM 12168 / CIP 105900 / DD5/3) TaxID=906968 RepID=F4LLK4_TREBD|nr:TetR/AcrR family transcriptional regulator [Treponema brennaborense]AEE16668.1 regulatory protein TetR [Treponema brennaborense DSM 12168]